jgi:hypothetical protein
MCFDAGTGLPMYREKIVPEPEEPAAVPAADEAAGEAGATDEGSSGQATPEPPRAPTFSASPVAANDLLYVISDAGDVYVIESGPFLRVRSVNKVGEAVFATPAISDDLLIVRGLRHLFAFSAAVASQ